MSGQIPLQNTVNELLRNLKAPEFRREDDADDRCYEPDHEAVLQWLVQRFGISLTLRKARRPDGQAIGTTDFYADSFIHGIILGSNQNPNNRNTFDPRGWFVNDTQLGYLRREIGYRVGANVGWLIYSFPKTGDVYHTTLGRIVQPGAYTTGIMTPLRGGSTSGIFVKPEVFWHLGNYLHEVIPSDFTETMVAQVSRS